MWYLYSLLFCYIIDILLMAKIVNQAECNGTPLTNTQIWVIGVIMLILLSIPLLNVVYGVNSVYSFIFAPYEL
jgi:hypothetical protein